MANRKYRPIVMNGNKRPGKTPSILKRILLITALLAFVEIIVLVVLHLKNKPKAVAASGEKRKDIPEQKGEEKTVAKAAGGAKPAATQKIITARKSPGYLVKDTLSARTTVTEKDKPFQPKRLKDSAVVSETQPEEIEIVNSVSDEQMLQILNDVRVEKAASKSAAKCVTVKIVNSRNADNGFKIANYLRKNGFVISGREVVKGTLKGIHIDAGGACIKLAVGNL